MGRGEQETVAAGAQRRPASQRQVVGIVADPGLPYDIARDLADKLADDFAAHVRDDVAWDVRLLCEALPLDSNGELQLAQYGHRLLAREGWDYIVCLTELPRRAGTRPLLYDVDPSRREALVSVPALGCVRLRAHARWAIVRILGELTTGAPPGRKPSRLPGRLATEVLSPVRHVSGDVESKAALAGGRGHLRLLAGMLRANRPWRLVPSLSSAIAAAVATAAFGVFYSSIWQMADAASALRLAVVNLFAAAAMVLWLVAHNHLWERRCPGRGPRTAVLYNIATVLTLTIGVACMYVLLFAFTLTAALVVIDPSFLQAQLRHSVALGQYLALAWLSSSMGTVAGALGSTLESEDAVRRATYGRREQERRARQDESEGNDEKQ